MTRNDRIAPAALVLLFVALCAAIGPFHPDRSFVTFRFAENLAAGHGIVYNAGDAPLEGYGNTLWLFACASLARVGFALPATAWLFSFLAGMAALLLLWHVLRARCSRGVSFVAAAFAALSGPLAVAAMSGEGAALVAALAVGTVVLLDRASTGRTAWIAAGAAGVLLAMCGNALVVVFPAALAVRVRSRAAETPPTRWVPGAIVFALGLAAFHVWRVSVFGSITAPAPGFDAGSVSAADLFVVQPHDMAPFGWLYLTLTVAAILGVAVAENRSFALLAAVSAGACGVVTLAARDPLPALATSAALVPLLMVPAAALLARAPHGTGSRGIGASLLGALLIWTLGGAMNARASARHLRESHDATLRPLGRWISGWLSDGTMLCGSPGAVAYYSGWRVDVVGGVKLPPEHDLVLLESDGMFIPEMDSAQSAATATLAGRYRILAAIRRDWTRDRAYIIYVHERVPKLTDEELAPFPHGIGSVARLFR